MFIPPIEAVFAYPMLEYYADKPELLRVYGEDTNRQALAQRTYPFDMPGTCHHAAFRIRKRRATPDVLIVDDHSCLTDSYLTDFPIYMECILATWGHVETRMSHYLAGSLRRERDPNPRGDGVEHWRSHPIALSQLLRSV